MRTKVSGPDNLELALEMRKNERLRNGHFLGQVEAEKTENGNGKLKWKTEAESGNGKAENW